MKVFFFSLLLFSFNAFATKITTNEPKVNFNGTYVDITKTCLTEDGEHLRAIVSNKVLETSVTYLKLGKCIRPGLKPGTCSYRLPSETKHYPLAGSYDVYKTHIVNGKFKVRTYSHSVNFTVPHCL